MFSTLNGKTAIITGSSYGIGKGIAKLLAREGIKVIVNYSKSEEKAL
jgi:3-oxoacyl-[acyl-carrier protein] reductase